MGGESYSIIFFSITRSKRSRLIYDELCVGQVLNTSRTFFAKTMKSLADAGAQGIILGCTEFNMLVHSSDSPVPTFDSTILHAKKAVDLSLA